MSIKQDAEAIAALVEEKQSAYGDSFGKSGEVLEELYPNGVPVEKYRDMLAIVRVLDKLFRIATDKDALGESPWRDIVGYGLLAQRETDEHDEQRVECCFCKQTAVRVCKPYKTPYCQEHADDHEKKTGCLYVVPL